MRASVHYEFYPAEETRVAWRAYTQSTEVQQVTEEERVVATPPIFIQRQFNYDRDLYGLGVDVQQGMGDLHLIGYGVDINGWIIDLLRDAVRNTQIVGPAERLVER